MATLEGFSCKLTSNPQYLNVYKVDELNDGNIFVTKSNNNVTVFGSSIHTVIESEVHNNAGGDGAHSERVKAASNNSDHTVDHTDTIDTTQNS